MNDFTKDELETFYLWIYDVPDQQNWTEDCDRTRYYRNLSIKLKNMIDNYCDHDFGINIENDKIECIHCGVRK